VSATVRSKQQFTWRFEREWRTDIPPRLFDYASAAVAATRLPVGSVVVLFQPGGRPRQGTSVYRVPGIDGDTFVFRYHVVHCGSSTPGTWWKNSA
jgi:hypothetical protein